MNRKPYFSRRIAYSAGGLALGSPLFGLHGRLPEFLPDDGVFSITVDPVAYRSTRDKGRYHAGYRRAAIVAIVLPLFQTLTITAS